MIVTREKPEEFIPKLMDQDAFNIVAYHHDFTQESREIEQGLEAALNLEKLKRNFEDDQDI